MLDLKSDTILTLEPGIVLHSLPDQDWFYAFNVINGDQFRLNRTSYWVLERIGTDVEWNCLIDDFLNKFDVPIKQGQNDLQQLANELYKQKIIRRKGNAEN